MREKTPRAPLIGFSVWPNVVLVMLASPRKPAVLQICLFSTFVIVKCTAICLLPCSVATFSSDMSRVQLFLPRRKRNCAHLAGRRRRRQVLRVGAAVRTDESRIDEEPVERVGMPAQLDHALDLLDGVAVLQDDARVRSVEGLRGR